jgi:ribonuclease T2
MVHSGARPQLRLRAGLPVGSALGRGLARAAFALAAATSPALAQSSSPPPAPATLSSVPFDFYVLALSWAPSFCAEAETSRGGAECAPGAKLGFVVHGLWPQNEHGYPHCDQGGARLPRYLLSEAGSIYPSVGLAIHEWRAHGACTGLSPSAYLANVRRARAAVQVPPQFTSPGPAQSLAPALAARAFLDANPRLRPAMFAITCRRGDIEEARLCMTTDLRNFRSCPEVARSQCRAGTMRVPAPR